MDDLIPEIQSEAALNPRLEKDLVIVRKIVSVATGIMLILIAGFLYSVLVADGLSFIKPKDTLIESEDAYQSLIGMPSGLTGKGVKVCVVDTGIELDHPDIDGYELKGWTDIVQGKTNPYDDNGHGTNMAGILIADGWLDGIAKDVDLYVAKVMQENGSGYEEDVAAGIDWCINSNTNIISLSLGGAPDILPFIDSGGRTIEDAVADATTRGIFVIAAAGNDGGEEDDGDVASPGGERRVICVGGVTESGGHWQNPQKEIMEAAYFHSSYRVMIQIKNQKS